MTPKRPEPDAPGPRVGVVVVAGSAGGLAALQEVLRELPADFPAPLLVMLHLDPRHESHLAELLGRATAMRVQPAVDGEAPQPGRVYVAVPDRHLEIDGSRRIRLGDSAAVHFARPAADRLFASAGEAYGPGTVAVILSGSGRDGSEGLATIRRAGGRTLAQSPETCRYPPMPREAIRSGTVDEVVPLSEIAPRLLQLAGMK